MKLIRRTETKYRGKGKAILAAALLGITQPANAINIVMVYDVLNSVPPAADPGAAFLISIMAEVEDTWESIIKDPETVTITYRYTPGTNGLANASMTQQHPNGKPKAGDIDVDTLTSGTPAVPLLWFYHLPRNGDEHWDMRQALYRDLSASEQAVRFNPNDQPHDLLEVSYRGTTNASAPADAANGFDLYTSLLHEVGHVLGLNGTYSNSGDVETETDAVFTGGNDFRAIFHVDTGNVERGHLEWNSPTRLNNPLMCGDCAETGARRLPTALDVITIASLGGWTNIDLPRKDFIGAVDVDFNLAGNWIGNRVPDAGDDVFVRHIGLAELSADAHVDDLFIGAQSIVDTESHRLEVDKVTTLEVDVAGGLIKPLLLVQPGGEFETNDLNIGPGTIFDSDDGDIQINDDVVNEGDFKGRGVIVIEDAFFNDGGVIRATDDEVLTLVAPPGNARFNLDGRDAEEGTLEAHDGDLVIDSGLNDPFDSTVSIRAGRFIEFRDGWTLNNGGELILDGGLVPDPTGRATLKGIGTLEGTITVDNEAAIQSPFIISALEGWIYRVNHTFASSARVELPDAGDRLAIFGANIEAGARFTGNGILLNGEGSDLVLQDGAHVDLKLTHAGHRFDIAGDLTGAASSERLNLMERGTVNFDLDDLPATGDFDYFEATTDVTIRGALELEFGISTPPIGTRWRIIQSAAASCSGVFSSVDVTGLSILRSARVEYFSDGVDVVIGGARLTKQLLDIIPGQFQAGAHYPFPLGQGERPNFVVQTSNPEILSSNGLDLQAHRAGSVTLRFEVEQIDGTIEVIEKEVTVIPPVNPSCPPYGLEAQLLDSGGQIDDHLGSSVALSGTTALGGAPDADAPGMIDSGKAVVWVRQLGAWLQQATLTVPGSAPADQAGKGVAIDGNLALVGVPGRGGDSGLAWLFGRNPAGVWSPITALTPPAAQAGRQFGFSVALFGEFALIGAPGDSVNGIDAGAVFLYRRTGPGTWTGVTVLRAADTVAGDRFGSSLAAGFGQIVIGAPGKDNETGAIYRFTPSSGAITEQDKFTLAAGAVGDRFGRSVAVGAGPVIAGGAPFQDTAALDGGAVGIYSDLVAGWSEVAMITVSGAAADDRFGWSVAGGECGLAAGAPRRDAGLPDGGTVHRIGLSAGSWQASSAILSPDRVAGDALGSSLAMDGPGLAVGASRDDDRIQDGGAVYVWQSGGGGAGDLFVPGGDQADWLDDFVDAGSDPFQGRLDADDDRDGKTRFWEYLQGGNPLTPEGRPERFLTGPDGSFEFRMRLARRAAGRYQMRLEHSQDGRFWKELPILPSYPAEGGEVDDLVFKLDPIRRGAEANDLLGLHRVRITGPQPTGLPWKTE